MKILSAHIMYYYYDNQYYDYTTKTYLKTLNMSQYESYPLITVRKNLCTFFSHFLFILLGKDHLKDMNGLKSALFSFQVKLYLQILLTRIWLF